MLAAARAPWVVAHPFTEQASIRLLHAAAAAAGPSSYRPATTGAAPSSVSSLAPLAAVTEEGDAGSDSATSPVASVSVSGGLRWDADAARGMGVPEAVVASVGALAEEDQRAMAALVRRAMMRTSGEWRS